MISNCHKPTHFRNFGHIYEELKVYEVIDPTNEEVAQKKILTKEIFETTVHYFENYKFEEAKINFQKVLEINPNDKTAQYYLSLTER